MKEIFGKRKSCINELKDYLTQVGLPIGYSGFGEKKTQLTSIQKHNTKCNTVALYHWW